MRVLIVEDEALIALNAEAVIEEAGFTVTGIAPSFAEARRLAGVAPPAVALVDISLTDGRIGLEVAEHLAAAYGTASVVATGNPDGIVVTWPVLSVLCKPYSEEALAQAVAEAAEAAARRGGKRQDEIGG